MSKLRSSVRPKSSKQSWGTILHPEFEMGYQKMTSYEVAQTVDRLYYVPRDKEPRYPSPYQKEMTKENINEMLSRMTTEAGKKAVDSNRTQHNSMYKNMGVVNSFAWKGYN